MLENAKVGQKAVRKMKNGKGEIWEFNAEIVAVKGKVVTALVYIDYGRTMRFQRDTGVNVQGEEYGWLELIAD